MDQGEIQKNTIENSPTKKESLKEESKETTQANCFICFDKEPDAVIMECGHGG